MIIASGGGDSNKDNDENNADNNGDDNAVECEAPTIDVTGTWIVTYTKGDNDCNFSAGQVETGFMLLAQSGNTVSDLLNDTSGELCGNSFTLNRSEDSFAGYDFSVTGAGSSTSLSGTREYSFPFYGGCSGTDTYTAVKTEDWFDTAMPITLPYASSSESIATAPGIKYYKFTTPEAGAVEVSVNSPDALAFYLLDSSLNKLDMMATLFEKAIYYSSESAGTYYVVVTSQVETDFTMTVSFIEPDPDDNDTYDTATAITLPYTSSGMSIGTPVDKDYYKFSTTVSGIIQARLHGSTGLDICLYDSAQDFIMCDSGDSPRVVSSAEGAETFYVVVKGYDNEMSDYTLIVSSDSEPVGPNADGNDDSDAATPIIPPYTSTDKSIDTVGDKDYYVFTTIGPGDITLYMANFGQLGLLLYDSSHNILGSSNGSCIEYTSGGAGTFYVGIEGFTAADMSDYTLTVSLEDPDADGNNTFGTATPVILPYTSNDMSIDPLGDSDYYMFTTSGAGTISADLTGLSGNLALFLYDNDQNILDFSANEGTANESIEYLSGETGSFYILVTTWEGITSGYTLNVSFTSE